MRRLLFACAVAGTLAYAMPAVAEPIAFVVAMKGSVTVSPAKGTESKAVLGRPLERGDKVKVGAGGSASLFFSDGNVVELGEGSSMTVGGKLAAADKKRVGPGAEVSGEVFAKVSKFITSDTKQAGLVALSPMRSGRGAEAAIILEPRRSSLMSGAPAFAWRSVAGATRYRVTVTGDDGELWSREVTDTTLAYPDGVTPLAEARDYAWQVQALSDLGPVRAEESSFHVLAAGEAAQVQDHLADIQKAAGRDSEAGRYLAGSYLVGRGLYADAAREFAALCRLAPGTPGAHQALGHVYRTVGLADLATTELERAQALSGEK